MGRRLALFFDGTWNTPGSETNVIRLYRLTRSHASFRGSLLRRTFRKDPQPDAPGSTEQLKYYHRGVGTTWGSRMLGGMFGYGLSKNIRDGLLWLATHYKPGDDIYLFGFSRGAYTARSLAGLIGKCGIPRDPAPGLADTAYRFYRERQYDPDGLAVKAFRQTYAWEESPIRFIGVWDTVGALGLPVHDIWFGKEWYRFHDTQLGSAVRTACHALALDEHRPDFAATVWTAAKGETKPRSGVEQRWFAGSHADVGGGYAHGKLHQIPLRWMQERAGTCGLEFSADAPVDDDAWQSPVHDSLREFAFGFYALLPWIYDHFRALHMGIHETVDDSIRRRTSSGTCKDALGRPYDPPALHAPEQDD